MIRVPFSFRFIIDRHFFDKVMKPNPQVFLFLMYISNGSAEYRRTHNLMSENIRIDLIRQNPSYSVEYIKSALNKVNEPEEIEIISDELTRNIKYAIHYTRASSDKITPICILTSDDMRDEYLNSQDLRDIKNVSIKSGEDAISLLKEYRDLVWDR